MLAASSSQHTLKAGIQEVTYYEVGSGEPLVCLPNEAPGSTGLLDYAANASVFSQRFRTILLDAPFAAAGIPDAAAAARLLADALDALDLQSVNLVGNGFGGEVALRFAAMAPQRVSQLILLGPTGCLFSPFTPPPLEGSKAIDAFWRSPSTASLKEALRLFVFDDSLNGEKVMAERLQTAQSQHKPPETSLTADVLSLAPLVTAPGLIVWGREDRLSPIDYGLNLLAHIQDAQFHMLPRCGHWPQAEHPEAVNSLVLDFLTEDV